MIQKFTYKKTENDKETEIEIKGFKKDIDRILEEINKFLGIRRHSKELSGIIGESESENDIFEPFGNNEPRDPEEYERKKENLIRFLGSKQITITDYPEIRTMRKLAFDEHVFIRDNRKTPEQAEADRIEQNKRFDEAKKQDEIRKAQRENQTAEALKLYPHLLKQENNKNLSSRILATKNIRLELETKYPGHKFSITSDSFSGGDSIDVRWEDGATYSEVNKIVRKYQEGRFDGMNDMYEYSYDPFNSLFGGVKYTNCSRSISKEAMIKIAESLGYLIEYTNEWEFSVKKQGEEETIQDLKELNGIRQEIKEKAGETNLYIQQETRATIPGAGNELFNVTYNPDKDGIEVKFPSKPSTEILDLLKSNGFRWGKFNKVWYKRASSIPGTNEQKCLTIARMLSEESGKDYRDNSEDGLTTQENQAFERLLQEESRREEYI